MRYTSEMSVLERMEFLTMKAEQAVERTANITDYRQFLASPDAMDLFDATVLRETDRRQDGTETFAPQLSGDTMEKRIRNAQFYFS